MKLAHLILAHNHPLQLERLVKRINHADADIYIHLDAKTDIKEYEHIKDLPNTSFIKNRIEVKWAEYTVIEATLSGLEEILETGIAYSHINLLSGNDYPLQRNENIHNFLFAHPDKTFMWYDKMFDGWIPGQVRINKYDLNSYGFPGRYQLAHFINKILPDRKLPGNLIAYGRSQWFCITPASAEYVIRYIKSDHAARRFFKMTWCVDEVFFQTILCNSHLMNTIVNDNLRYCLLDPGFRPVIFKIEDGGKLISSGKFYTRKFDYAVDSAIFDYLDSKSV